MTATERVCRSCDRTFLSTNGYATCSSCRYARSRETGEPCPGCGGPKDRRSRRCLSCRESNQRRGPRPEMRGPRQDVDAVLARAAATAEAVGECMLVTAWSPQPKGYIRAPRVDDRPPQMLHRLVVERRLGRRLTDDETVDHTCHNGSGCAGGPTCQHRRCMNVEHLDVVDAITNWERGNGGVVRERAQRTHCPNGHPYEAANLRAGKARACKACHRARAAGRDPRAEPTYR